MTATFYVGDAIEVLSKLPEKSVDLVISSPPFLALRSYLPADHPDKALEGGSQATPGEYVDWLLDVVEACARVLAPHGSLCFELGDTYGSSGGATTEASGAVRVGGNNGLPTITAVPHVAKPGTNSRLQSGPGWPLAKSLSLIPESFRWAMVYGHNPFTGRKTEPWRLRNVIRWVRPNPPVGALGDKFRPATSELMVFCKTKDRYFDLDAVREPYLHPNHPQVGKNPNGTKDYNEDELLGARRHVRTENPAGAPPLDWWNIPPTGYAGAHYAVWPPELLVKPIKAMCPETVCRVCGEPRRRIVEKTEEYATFRASKTGVELTDARKAYHLAEKGGAGSLDHREDSGARGQLYETVGFTDCDHKNFRVGCVLDPFAGTGTTLAVATGHGRDAIGIDLDERNYALALDRVGPLILEKATL